MPELVGGLYAYLWNSYSVSVFPVLPGQSNALVLSYGGRHPQVVAESMVEGLLLKRHLDWNELLSASYSIHDHYDQVYFPVQSVNPKINSEVISEISALMDWRQTIVVDGDDLQNLNYIHSGAIDPTIPTAWVLTGDLVYLFRDNLESVAIEIATSFPDLPHMNQIFIDRFNVLNYSSVLGSCEVMSTSLVKLPINLVKTIAVKQDAANNISLKLIDGVERKLYLGDESINVFEVDQEYKLSGRFGWEFEPGYLVVVDPRSISQQKNTRWKHKFAPVEYIHVENPFALGRMNKRKSQFRVDAKPITANLFLEMNPKETRRLIVVHGQKVREGDYLRPSQSFHLNPFTLRDNPILSPINGVVDLSLTNLGFIKLIADKPSTSEELPYWLKTTRDMKPRPNKEYDILTQVESFPLFTALGKDVSVGRILPVRSIEDLDKRDLKPDSIVIVRKTISAKDLAGLFRLGVLSVVAPDIEGLESLPGKYLQVFSLGLVGHKLSIIPDSFWKRICRYVDFPVNLIAKTAELKIMLDFNPVQTASKFALQKYPDNINTEISRGACVRISVGNLWGHEAKVISLEGEYCVLEEQYTKKIFRVFRQDLELLSC